MAGLTTWFSDTLTNLATGLGYASKDKSASTLYGFGFLDQNQLLAAYRGDWIARKAVDIPAKDATRAWRNWQAKNDQIEKLEKVERSLNIQRKVCSALIRSRLLGGGGLILGTGTGNPESELDPTTIGLGGLKYVHVFGRYDVWVDEINRDITSMYFGEPKFYMVNRSDGTQIKVHPSRVVRFGGNEIPDYNQQFVDGWGDSVLQSIDDAVKQAGSTAANLSQIIYEAKLDIIKVPGLMEHLATKEYTDRMIKRFSSANMLKGGANALLLDTAEEWETRVQTFQGFSDIIGAYLMIASAAVDVPATRFLAQSPGGLQSTGEADIRNYYDRIKSDQKMDIQPALARLDAVLVPSALGSTPEEVYYEWASLWQQTEEQKAETSLKKAQAFKIDVDSGLHPDDALAKARQNQLIEDGVYPGFEDALDEAEMDPFEEPDPEMVAMQVAAGATKGLPAMGAKPAAVPVRKPMLAKDAAPRTLYVRRDVLNVSEIVKWAEGEGFTDIVTDLHVTVAYSRKPVDWFKVGTSWTEKIEIVGGPRLMEKMGPDGRYKALLMTAPELVWRHREMVEAGAVWEWAEYQPHISIQIGGDVDLSKVKPYQGKIVLGPEIFEEVRTS